MALDTVETRLKREPIGVFHDALNNVKPGIEVRSRRVGGATYQVPVEVRPERAQALAIRWLISAARARSEKTMSARLSGELMDASQNRGNAVKKREDTHRMPKPPRLQPLSLVVDPAGFADWWRWQKQYLYLKEAGSAGSLHR